MQDIQVKIFISYAHEDRKLCKKFMTHLCSLKKSDMISHWHDNEINPGEVWDEEIRKKLDESDLIIFLLSPDLIASEYIEENELKLSIKKHRNGEAYIIPVMLRNCNYKYTYFNNLQGLPEGFTAIKSKRYKSIDDAFFEVVAGIDRVIEKIIKDKKNIENNKNNEPAEQSVTKKVGVISNFLNLLKRKITTKYVEITTKYLETDLTSKIVILENQRREISKDLHDNILGRLFGIRINFETAISTNNIEKIEQSIDELKLIESNIREISHFISKDVNRIDMEFNLDISLKELEKHFKKLSTINFNFKTENLSYYHNSAIEVNCYRIIQELVNNVCQHSKATKCDVVAKYLDKKLFLKVKDNGIGFDIDKRNYYRSGISNVIERVNYYNGAIKINSHPEKGTEFLIEF